jgi:hypothetical protein
MTVLIVVIERDVTDHNSCRKVEIAKWKIESTGHGPFEEFDANLQLPRLRFS